MLFSTLSGSTPWLMVRLPWGSMSTARTRWPDSLKATARLRAVVVLATPHFWLAKAITLAGPSFLGESGCFPGVEGCSGPWSPLSVDPAAVVAADDLFGSGVGATRSSGLMRPDSSAV